MHTFPLMLRPTTDDVIQATALVFGLTPADVCGPRRFAAFVRARHAAFLVLREHGLSLNHIGEAMGGRDHTTVIHGCRKAQEDAAQDLAYATRLDAVRARVAGVAGAVFDIRDLLRPDTRAA